MRGAPLGVASVGAVESIDAFIDRLPKAELHLHLVGSASVPTVLELARRHPDGGVPVGVRRCDRGRAHSVPHAGEMSGPATIWEALTSLRAERIGHGISCLDDPGLVARLRESQVPLEVCPTSNVCTRQVPDLAAHPLPRLLEQGLFVTLNSDDPPMFGTTLTQEYRWAASALGLDREQLAALAANGVRASFLDAAAKQALVAEIEAVASGDGHLPQEGNESDL